MKKTLNWKDPFVYRDVEIFYDMDFYDRDEINVDSIEIFEGDKDLTPFFARLNNITSVNIWDLLKDEINNQI